MATFNGTDYTLADFTAGDGFDYVEIWDQFWTDVLAELTARAAAMGAAIPLIADAWDAGTADANPGPGAVRGNNPALSAVTQLYISTADAAGVDVSAIIGLFDDSTSTPKGVLRLGHRTNAAKWAVFSVTGVVTVASGYCKVPVSYTAGPGGFSAADPVAIGFVPVGNIGQAGSNGAGPNWGGTSGGSANAQTLTPAVALGSLTGNPSYEFIAGYSPTGPFTLNVSGTGAASVRKPDGTAAGNGDVVAGTKYVVTLVSGQWRLAGGGGANLAAIHAAMFSF